MFVGVASVKENRDSSVMKKSILGMTSSNDDSIDTILVYGYHGTSRSRAERVIADGFQPSTNGYDWLDTGVYFWQDAPNHALNWARKMYRQEPVVINSRLRLEITCLDLLDMADIDNPDLIGLIRSAFVEENRIKVGETNT